MSVELIPVINVDTFEEAQERIKQVEPFVKWIHIDIEDGTFTKKTNWHNAAELAQLETHLNIELHIMLDSVERRIEEWLMPNVQRIIFHLEATHNPDFVIEKIRDAKKQVGISIKPETSWIKLVPYCGKAVDMFQILSVHPGPAAQKFIEDSLDKVRHLRKECPQCIIEVDGGIKKGVAKRVAQAGANIIVSASAIFSPSRQGEAEADAPNIETAINELKVELHD